MYQQSVPLNNKLSGVQMHLGNLNAFLKKEELKGFKKKMQEYIT